MKPRDKGAFDFLISRGYTPERIRALIEERQKTPSQRLRGLSTMNTVEREAVRLLAGFSTDKFLWQCAARNVEREERARDAKETSDPPSRLRFRQLAIAVLKDADKADEILSSASLCERVIDRLNKNEKLPEYSLPRWAAYDFPHVKSNRGRKSKPRNSR